jgi:hypothetical protein
MKDCLNDAMLQAWLDGELSAEDAAAAQSHVAACEACAASARVASQALSLADDGWEAGLPATIPTARLRARLAETSAVPPGLVAFRGGRRAVLGWAVAAAIVILALATPAVLRTRSLKPLPEAAGLVQPARPAAAGTVRPLRRTVRTESETTRHLEQTEQLLRSIRNAEAEHVDWAYDLELSRELLNRNRLLRRRAAQKQDNAAEKMLVHVEPILLDIANLSDQPVPGEFALLKEMIRTQSIIPELQLYAARVGS